MKFVYVKFSGVCKIFSAYVKKHCSIIIRDLYFAIPNQDPKDCVARAAYTVVKEGYGYMKNPFDDWESKLLYLVFSFVDKRT